MVRLRRLTQIQTCVLAVVIRLRPSVPEGLSSARLNYRVAEVRLLEPCRSLELPKSVVRSRFCAPTGFLT